MTELFIIVFLFLSKFVCVRSLSDDPHALSFDRLYTLGVAAYEEERWFQCVSFMSRAIEEQKYFSDVVYKCRLQCKKGANERLADFQDGNNAQLLNLYIFQDLFLNVECVRRCKKKNLGEGPRARGVFKSICQAFTELKPYDYLQICAFQTDDVKQAVAAAYTFFLGNPQHSDMLNNLQYYRNLPDIKNEDFINLEEQSFQTHYIEGTEAYGDEDWVAVIEEMETALEEFFTAEERCHLECEGLLDFNPTESSADILSTITVLYAEILRCQLGCEDKLGVIHSKLVPDYVADHYHYLQYAYFKLKNYEKSATAAESFLLFKPKDDIMLNNKLYFIKRGHGETLFVPRPKAVEYAKRKDMMREILGFFETVSGNDDYDDEDSHSVYIKKNYVTMGDYRGNPGEFQMDTSQSPSTPFVQHFERLGIKVFADGQVLQGPERFAADGLMRPEQCQELIYLVQAKHDKDQAVSYVHDINIPEAVELVKQELTTDMALRILLRSSEVVRFFMQQYLNLTKLYLQSTQVVCRDHRDNISEDRTCFVQEDGSCHSKFPIDKKTDYVAAIHLNKVMKGGEIYMANEKLNGQGMMVPPKCGRMVGFPSSVPHGILPFPSGVRCAMVVGFSKNRTNDEKAHSHAFRFLDRLEEKKQEEQLDRLRNRKSVLQGIKDDGIAITMTEDELGGEERVVADNVLTQEGCENLLKLAMTGGRGGDGYDSGKGLSPHTDKETFKGLSIDRAVKNGSLRGDGYRDKRYNTQSSISPHTKHEMFQGLTILRAAQLANLGVINEELVQLYLNHSERARDLVEKYFNMESPLYFDFTHLVCRKSIEVESRDDLSHPVHADNCILQDDQSCIRQFPAYTQRDYSAILYLSDDFDGGDFFFAHANKSEQVSVRPKCGRLVGFNAGAYHGVKAVTRGERCALALWFTLDPDFREIAHVQARKMLRDRKMDPTYSLPSSSPLFTMPGFNEEEPAFTEHDQVTEEVTGNGHSNEERKPMEKTGEQNEDRDHDDQYQSDQTIHNDGEWLNKDVGTDKHQADIPSEESHDRSESNSDDDTDDPSQTISVNEGIEISEANIEIEEISVTLDKVKSEYTEAEIVDESEDKSSHTEL